MTPSQTNMVDCNELISQNPPTNSPADIDNCSLYNNPQNDDSESEDDCFRQHTQKENPVQHFPLSEQPFQSSNHQIKFIHHNAPKKNCQQAIISR